jgi:two-component system alkaline phosphatase synthesis response regulator PhoP
MIKTKTNFPDRANGRAADARSGGAKAAAGSDTQATSGRKTRILIVEDEPAMVAGLRDNFEYEGYDVISADDGESGLERALADDPDLVVLDVMMPRMSGLEVCKRVKARRPSIPIIMLTARGQEIDKVVGLELGADDYVTKPFSIRELLARVKAVLRRVSLQARVPEVYRFSDVEVNIRGNEVRRAGKPVDLSAKEFALLAYFISHPSETLSRDRLLDAVWGYENYPTTRTVDTHIVHLRQKLEPNPEEPRFILTVHGTGYKFVE